MYPPVNNKTYNQGCDDDGAERTAHDETVGASLQGQPTVHADEHRRQITMTATESPRTKYSIPNQQARTPEKMAAALRHLPIDDALNKLRIARLLYGPTPQLDKLGLLLLKPGAKPGEEVWS